MGATPARAPWRYTVTTGTGLSPVLVMAPGDANHAGVLFLERTPIMLLASRYVTTNQGWARRPRHDPDCKRPIKTVSPRQHPRTWSNTITARTARGPGAKSGIRWVGGIGLYT